MQHIVETTQLKTFNTEQERRNEVTREEGRTLDQKREKIIRVGMRKMKISTHR